VRAVPQNCPFGPEQGSRVQELDTDGAHGLQPVHLRGSEGSVLATQLQGHRNTKGLCLAEDAASLLGHGKRASEIEVRAIDASGLL
jgi:hypothetical protein